MQEKTEGHSVTAKDGFGIASALLMAYGITIPVIFILATILTFTDFPEKYTTIAVFLGTLSGLFAAGYKTGSSNEKNGMLKGTLTGLAYMLILYVISSIIFKDFMVNPRTIVMTVTGILAGAIGGMIGAGRKSKPLSRLSGAKGNDPFKKYRR